MRLSDTQLLHTAQCGGDEAASARDELPARFDHLLRYLAGRACKLYGLDASERDDIIQRSLLALFDPTKARFAPTRSDGPETYLRGLVQNAARSHARFVRRGDEKKHSYLDAVNSRRNLPSMAEEIEDTRDTWAPTEAREVAVAVMSMATPDERGMVLAVFYRSETPEEVGVGIGVARSTVARRLSRLFLRFRERQVN